MSKRNQNTVIPAVIIALLLCAGPSWAGERLFEPGDVLASAKIAGKPTPITTGPWGQNETVDGRTFRTYRGKDKPTRVAIARWWTQTASPSEGVVLAFTYRDSAKSPMVVLGWNAIGGRYGYNYIGQFGGSGDGKWKQALLYVTPVLIKSLQGRWVVHFSGADPVAFEQIDVVKANEKLKQEAISQCRQARAAHIEKIKKVFEEDPWKGEGELGEPGETFTQLGFVPYARNYTRDVYPASVPTPAERDNSTLRAYAALGEIEPIQVAAMALRDVTLTASLSDLRGPAVLKAGKDVVLQRIECITVRSGGGSSVKKWQVKPVWLRPNAPAKLKARANQAWYINVHVPAEAKAGLYKGTLTISASASSKVDMPIEFTVLPFALDKADHFARGAYISGPLAEDWIQNLVDHRLNSSSAWPGGLDPSLVDGKCIATPSEAMDRYLRRLKEVGFVRFVHFGGGDPRYNNPANVPGKTRAKVGSPEFEKYYAEYWNDIRRLEKANDWPEMICCPFDEPVKSEAKTKNYLICHNIIKKFVPDTQTFCVFMNRPWAAKKMGGDSDIFSINGAFEQAQAEKQAQAAKGKKKLIYTYTVCMASSRPGASRYNSGFGPWKYDADGVYFWAYKWYTADPFNCLDGSHADWSPAARDVDGEIYDSAAFEGWREGFEDRLYAETCIRMAKEKGRADILARMDQLKKDVVAGKESEVSARTHGLDDFFFSIPNTSVLDVYRARIVAMIMEMQTANHGG